MTRTTRRTRSHPLRHTLAAAAALPALLLPLTACDSGGDSDKGSKSSDKSSSSGKNDGGKGGGADDGKSGEDNGSGGGNDKGGESDKPDKGSAKPLSPQQLRSALLTAKEAPGYRVQHSKSALDDNPPQAGEECRPLIDLFSKDSEQKRLAWVAASLIKGGKGQFSTQSTVHQVLLSAYQPGDAKTFVGNLKTATHKCPEIVDTSDSDGDKDKVIVEPEASPGLGDDSVRFTMGSAEKKPSGISVTVVRSGANTMTFMSTSLTGKRAEAPKQLVDKQLAKLEAAAAKP
ncbi:hypothetical protein ACQEU8_32470 [Streptomyces sp. CA-250714]|uniref:hypothetical protein n=1 Tax=Streptomyces sp. CA-250714 TaxID=3240060 RepID=UPI003D89CFEA